MRTSTFPMNNENEAVALANFFADCGISSTRKGKAVIAKGEPSLLSYLYEKFVTIALI